MCFFFDRSLTSVGGGGKVENCLHDPSTLSHFFKKISQVFRFWPECSKIRCVQKPNAHRVPFCRIKVPFFSVVYFSKGTLPTKKTVRKGT